MRRPSPGALRRSPPVLLIRIHSTLSWTTTPTSFVRALVISLSWIICSSVSFQTLSLTASFSDSIWPRRKQPQSRLCHGSTSNPYHTQQAISQLWRLHKITYIFSMYLMFRPVLQRFSSFTVSVRESLVGVVCLTLFAVSYFQPESQAYPNPSGKTFPASHGQTASLFLEKEVHIVSFCEWND